MFFRDVTLGPHEASLRFRLIHLWEAINPKSKTLIGQEMILIDEEGTVIKGFVPAGRVGTYDLVVGSVYKLKRFFGSRNKDLYRVVDHEATVSFSWNSQLSVLQNHPVPVEEDRIRLRSVEEFQANCDAKGDLYDYLGHMKLVNDQIITEHTVLDEVDIMEKRHLCVHVQTHDDPVVKLYLWDKAAFDFCQKFNSSGIKPSVLLVTTLNPKRIGGTLCLTSMASSRVFMDSDVGLTRDYLGWLSSNGDIANKIDAHVVTKPEPLSLEEIFAYIKQESAKVAWFECTATIDDVIQGTSWYYISCDACNSKAVKGPISLFCNNNKCEKRQVPGVPQYLTKISVYDKSEQAVFVVLGDAGKVLTGKPASELVACYFEANEGAGADHCVPVPRAFLDAIGKTFKFIVKISDHNLTGKIQSLTVTKILPADAPTAGLEDDGIAETAVADLEAGSGVAGSSPSVEGSAGDKIRKASDDLETDEPKRTKSG
ncbi:unnamed protein product [Eruca vesicaria subsp. sativa]|uniref:Replication factor A C-terminal domain-containing protein n=1 Tax=Eruca vesicaria subsp. sativa TaxID=29727 RepID=A0ABC8KGN7_ERUVS|nr:unnamed protein product [Eruca vesicaria subsp. sativa]